MPYDVQRGERAFMLYANSDGPDGVCIYALSANLIQAFFLCCA